MQNSSFIQLAFSESQRLVNDFSSQHDNLHKIEIAINMMVDSLKGGGKILSCGNGGSMSDAMHFAEELTGRFRKDRRPLPAMAISDPAHLTCVANDFGYDQIFSRVVDAFGKAGDILLAISTSGKSSNILEATKVARSKGMRVIALSGKEGVPLKDLADVALVIPTHATERIQELHIKIIHIMIEGIERQIFPELWKN